MLRLKTSALDIRGDKAYYQYKPFAGIGFSLVNGIVEEIKEYRDGMNVGDYHSPYIPNAENEICIDEAMLEGEKYEGEPPFLHDGQRFSGIVYDFDGDHCVGELQLRNGRIMADVYVTPMDQLEYMRFSYWGIFQEFEWHENGSFKEIEITETKSNCRLGITFDEQQRIKSFEVSEDYFERLPKIEGQLKFNYIKSRKLSEYVDLASDLFLIGPGIDDALLAELQTCSGYSELRSIKLSETALSMKAIIDLSAHENVTQISVDDDKRPDILATLTQLKKQRPDLLVEVEDVEIT